MTIDEDQGLDYNGPQQGRERAQKLTRLIQHAVLSRMQKMAAETCRKGELLPNCVGNPIPSLCIHRGSSAPV